MPPKGVKSSKLMRQYEDLKRSAKSRGASIIRRAKEMAGRTVSKQRGKSGRTRKLTSSRKRR